jgi:hypothetical protein
MRPTILISCLGTVIGVISAFSFPTTSLQLPGVLFGTAVTIIYLTNSHQESGSKRVVSACGILIAGLICYDIALYITSTPNIVVSIQNPLIATPVAAAIGGFVATWIFSLVLQVLTKRFSKMEAMFLGVYGGLLGAVLIDSIAYVTLGDSSNSGASTLFVGSCVFFIGWQTIMLLIISKHLQKS